MKYSDLEASLLNFHKSKRSFHNQASYIINMIFLRKYVAVFCEIFAIILSSAEQLREIKAGNISTILYS